MLPGPLRRPARAVVSVAGIALVTVGVAVPAGAQAGDRAAPSGDTRAVAALAPGVSLTTIRAGHPSPTEVWTVTVAVPEGGAPPSPDPDAPQTVLAPRSDADALAGQLRAAGFSPRVERVDNPRYADLPAGVLGWRVRIGRYTDQAAATAGSTAVKDAGFLPSVDYTGDDGHPTTGPWRIRVLRIDPRRFTGTVRASYGAAVAGRQRTSEIAAADGALAAVNAGFFVISPDDGIPGEPAGIGDYDGTLDSEASNGRVALLLDHNQARIAALSTRLRLRSDDGARTVLDGINRKPGLIRDCGGVGGDQPTQGPLQDITCTDPSEIVQFTPALGEATPTGPGTEVTLDGRGRVTSVGARGGAVPAGGSVLQGTGAGAAWLQAHAAVGRRLHVGTIVRDGGNRLVALHCGLDIVGGGPWLVRGGRPDVDVRADGIMHPGDPSFMYGWGVRRNPRTMVGVDAHHRLLLATVDGRQPGFSAGMTLGEEARFMRSLGAVDAMNLDGGGSTAMAIRGRLVNSPSDSTGERPVGDVLEVSAPRP